MCSIKENFSNKAKKTSNINILKYGVFMGSESKLTQTD